MTTKELLIEKIKVMPDPLLQKLLDFIDNLQEEQPSPKSRKEAPKSSSKKTNPKKSLYGIWAEHGKDITREDIDEIRKEMWGNFPRDDI